MAGFSHGGNVRGQLPPIDLDAVFGKPAGETDSEGVLIDPNSRVTTTPENKIGQPKPPDVRPSQPTGAELEKADRVSQEFRDSSQLEVLSGEIDEILNQVHSMQVAKIGNPKNSFADLIVRNLVREIF